MKEIKTNFNAEDMEILLEYLKKHKFKEENLDKNNNYQGYSLKHEIDVDDDFDWEEFDYFPGTIYVEIRDYAIYLQFTSYYDNYIEEECHEFCKVYKFDEIDGILDTIDWYLNNNPITHKMTSTILFCNGKRCSPDDLENTKEECEYDDDEFLELCGFNNLQEYEEYKDNFVKFVENDVPTKNIVLGL